MTARYILIDAPGRYGTYATIYESHATLEEAMASASKQLGAVVVVDDGGWHETHRPGGRIHAEHARQYDILWSLAIARKNAKTAKERREAKKWRAAYDQAAEAIAKKYGAGSQQYFAALDDWARSHGASWLAR